MLKNKDTVKLIAGSTRLVSAATPDALKAMAKTLLEIAAVVRHKPTGLYVADTSLTSQKQRAITIRIPITGISIKAAMFEIALIDPWISDQKEEDFEVEFRYYDGSY